MRIPRDITGQALIIYLKPFGDIIFTRQTDSEALQEKRIL